jgi:cytochrome b6-f complex iron-sulfur subunit
MSSRRDFLKRTSGTVVACVAGAALASYLQSCTSVKYISAAEKDGKVIVSKTEFAGQPFVVVKTPSSSFPVYLVKANENYVALLMQCTHKQCEVKPAGTALYCPCHGSEFSSTGKVLKEPASRDLQSFIVTHDDQNVYIHLK